MLYICELSNKFDLNQTIRVLHTCSKIFTVVKVLFYKSRLGDVNLKQNEMDHNENTDIKNRASTTKIFTVVIIYYRNKLYCLSLSVTAILL
jgi:hypothetical protein